MVKNTRVRAPKDNPLPQTWGLVTTMCSFRLEVDNALDLLDVVNANMENASLGTAVAGSERHPRGGSRCVAAGVNSLPSLAHSPVIFKVIMCTDIFISVQAAFETYL